MRRAQSAARRSTLVVEGVKDPIKEFEQIMLVREKSCVSRRDMLRPACQHSGCRSELDDKRSSRRKWRISGCREGRVHNLCASLAFPFARHQLNDTAMNLVAV